MRSQFSVPPLKAFAYKTRLKNVVLVAAALAVPLVLQSSSHASSTPWSDLPRRYSDLLSHKPAKPVTPSTQGIHPSGELIQASDGMFYGVTMFGGTNNTGTVYRLDVNGGGFTTIYSFPSLDSSAHNKNGAYPVGALEEDANNPGTFYGAAFQGGSNGNGTLYKVTSAGTSTLLHTFGAIDSSGNNPDGYLPLGGLVQAADGNFYGVAAHGGTTGNNGTLFKLTSSGTFSLLHTFNGKDGRIPMGIVEDRSSHGVFYGTTEANGPTTKNGTVFKVTASGTFTTLHNFANANTSNPAATEGINPGAGLTQSSDGTYFCGTTRNGGYYGGGTAYKVTRNGTVSVLYLFKKTDSYGTSLTGSLPESLLVEDNNHVNRFLGTTPFGGSYGHGTVYEVFGVKTPLPGGAVAFASQSPIHEFAGTDGDKPYFGLVQANDNWFHGIAPFGGGFKAGNYVGNGLSFSAKGSGNYFQSGAELTQATVSQYVGWVPQLRSGTTGSDYGDYDFTGLDGSLTPTGGTAQTFKVYLDLTFYDEQYLDLANDFPKGGSYTLSGTSTYKWLWTPYEDEDPNMVRNDPSKPATDSSQPYPPPSLYVLGFNDPIATTDIDDGSGPLTGHGDVKDGFDPSWHPSFSSVPGQAPASQSELPRRSVLSTSTETSANSILSTAKMSPYTHVDIKAGAGFSSGYGYGFLSEDAQDIELVNPEQFARPDRGDSTNQYVYDGQSGTLSIPAEIISVDADIDDANWLVKPNTGGPKPTSSNPLVGWKFDDGKSSSPLTHLVRGQDYNI